jgi:polysaccharide export outer membrane protein
MDIKKLTRGWVCGLGLAAILLAGCETTESGQYGYDPLGSDPGAAVTGTNGAPTGNVRTAVLRTGDEVIVNFADLVNPIPPADDTIKDDGTITLIYNEKFQAVGKTIGELQDEIRKRYVPAYFVNMTPTIKVQDRFYSVGGEVRSPNRFLWIGDMTVLQAVNTAGGFTDFASRGSVILTRANGEQVKVNCKKAISKPELDLKVYPGDKIHVSKRLW